MNLTIEVKITNTATNTEGPFINSSVVRILDIDVTKEPHSIEFVATALAEGHKVMVDKINDLFMQK